MAVYQCFGFYWRLWIVPGNQRYRLSWRGWQQVNDWCTLSASKCLSYFISPCHSLHIHHPEKKNKGVFHQITKTHGTIICVSTGVVLLLLIVSILVQVKQPRKKVIKTSHNNLVIFSIIPQHITVELANLSSVFNHNLKVLVRKNNLFHRGDFQEVFDPPHYELFNLRDKVSLLTLVTSIDY